METLVLIVPHQNQKSQILDRFGTSPSRGFGDINCRTFESDAGMIPSPPSVFPCFTTPPAPPKQRKRSSPIPISTSQSPKETTTIPDTDYFSCSELWAGPAYWNSPPPSSLPIPKFSLRQKRSVSLDLPPLSGMGLHPVAKSAPTSPTRGLSSPTADFFRNTASATENLRRILNLDITED